MTLEQLRARLAEIHDELRAIDDEAGDVTLTEEQQTRFDALIAQRGEREGEMAAIERRTQQRALVAALPRGRGAVEDGDGARGMDRDPLGDVRDADARRGRRDPWDMTGVQVFGRSEISLAEEFRSRTHDAIERMPGMTDQRRSALARIVDEFDDIRGTLSRHVLITSNPDYLRAFTLAMYGRQGEWGPTEHAAVAAVRDQARAMSLTDSAGGYLIPMQLDPTLILTSDGSVNPIRGIARTVVATGDVWRGVSTTHATWRWAAEGTQSGDNSTTFAQPEITNYKADGFIPISIEALGDEANVTQAIATVLARGREDLEATAFIAGSGSGQPYGIVTALTGTSSVVASATTDTFAVGDLYAVEEALPAKYRPRAQWVAGKATYNDVRQFGTSDSHALWARLGDGQPAQLLMYPAHEASAIDSTINASADNYTMVLGDWENFVITDRLGMAVEYIPHLMGAQGRPTGERGFYAYYRTGSDSVNDGAFRMLNVT